MVKFNRIPIFLITCVFIITAALGVWLLVYGNGQADDKVLDIEKLYVVNIYGTEGYGYVDLQLDAEYLQSVCDSTGVELGTDDVRAELSRENNLCNGDKFTLSLKEAKKLKDMGFTLTKENITYSVQGLKEGTDFDVFSDVVVYLEGGKAVIDSSGSSNFVRDNVDFFIKNQLETYKEGDTVIVGVHIDMNAATDNGYNIEKTEQEYILAEQEKTND